MTPITDKQEINQVISDLTQVANEPSVDHKSLLGNLKMALSLAQQIAAIEQIIVDRGYGPDPEMIDAHITWNLDTDDEYTDTIGSSHSVSSGIHWGARGMTNAFRVNWIKIETKEGPKVINLDSDDDSDNFTSVTVDEDDEDDDDDAIVDEQTYIIDSANPDEQQLRWTRIIYEEMLAFHNEVTVPKTKALIAMAESTVKQLAYNVRDSGESLARIEKTRLALEKEDAVAKRVEVLTRAATIIEPIPDIAKILGQVQVPTFAELRDSMRFYHGVELAAMKWWPSLVGEYGVVLVKIQNQDAVRTMNFQSTIATFNIDQALTAGFNNMVKVD